MNAEVAARVRQVVVDVVLAATRDAGRTRLAVVDAGTPEGTLLTGWLEDARALPIERVSDPAAAYARMRDVGSDVLLVNPANKTVAVLWPETLAEPVLPLADLYATQVARLAGGWYAPPEARAWLERAGGVEHIDAVLMRHLDERRPLEEALGGMDGALAGEFERRLRAGWWWRRRLGVVPKLGSRTLGIDLR